MTAPRTPRPGSARKPLRGRDTGPGPALRLVTGCAGQLPGAGTGPRRDQPGAAGLGAATAAGLGAATAAGQAAATAGPGTLTPLAWLQVEQAREALETLAARARDADLATAMLLVGETSRHTQFLLALIDALTAS
jgi:hypothetical protein